MPQAVYSLGDDQRTEGHAGEEPQRHCPTRREGSSSPEGPVSSPPTRPVKSVALQNKFDRQMLTNVLAKFID